MQVVVRKRKAASKPLSAPLLPKSAIADFRRAAVRRNIERGNALRAKHGLAPIDCTTLVVRADRPLAGDAIASLATAVIRTHGIGTANLPCPAPVRRALVEAWDAETGESMREVQELAGIFAAVFPWAREQIVAICDELAATHDVA